MPDWEECDIFSFEDSDRFEEDSLCSWSSEPESLCNNWRGWKRPSPVSATFGSLKKTADELTTHVPSLVELAARCVASHIPFELVEHVYPPVPELLQLRIAFWSFPDNEEDIRLYSCLANGSAEEFSRGENLFKNRGVKDTLQIGFHLSATVFQSNQNRPQFNVAVTFDRRRITSCNCTCSSTAYWCSHVVAVCLHRIHLPTQVCLRAPVSESLSRLQREQLQKFAQYLISELPQQILPTAQRLLDELLSSQATAINTVCGAPDPTAGASVNDQTSWYLDGKTLHDNIKKILIKFCVPAPIVFSDVNYLSTTAPPAAAEWSSLLRPLRGREPEGMWNLLSIVREMFKRNDRNAVPLLEIITEECMAIEQIIVWWFNTKVALHIGNSGHGGGKHNNVNSNSHASQHACSSLCDEIVVLWRLAALNPELSPEEREMLHNQFKEWHLKIVEKVMKSRGGGVVTAQSLPGSGSNSKNANSLRNDIEIFTGFKPAIEACYLDWEDYPIPGITYSSGISRLYHCPFTCFRHAGDSSRNDHIVVNQVNSSQAVLNCELPSTSHHHTHHHNHHHHHHHNPHLHGVCHMPRGVREYLPYSDRRHLKHHDFSMSSLPMVSVSENGRSRDGNRSSVSSEGFCENDPDADMLTEAVGLTVSSLRMNGGDTDSQEGGGSDSASSSEDSVHGRRTGISDPCKKGRNVDLTKARIKHSNDIHSEDSDGSITKSSDLCLQLSMLSTCSSDHKFHKVTDSTSLTISDTACFSSENSHKSNDLACGTPISQNKSSIACKKKPILLQEAADGDSDASASGVSPTDDSEHSRRPSKDESLSSSNSDSQQSGDEFNVYFYDPKALTSSPVNNDANALSGKVKPVKREDQNPLSPTSVFANLKKTEDPWDILFSRAEGLHAHGHGKEACTLGVRLAEELLAHPPDLMIELPPLPIKGKRKKQMINPASHQLSCLASATLAKCAFLCTVLAESPEHYHLAFRVGIFALEMARPPASTKPLEVKLANQESELVNLLKRIPLSNWELKIIRERAQQLKDGTLKSRGEALLPIMLASYLFDVLVMPGSKETRCHLLNPSSRLPTDESLGFEAAVAALGLKANVSEADHPLLCEGTRRQRGDLAITLLVHYKDDPEKIARIMDKLLDREVHQLVKTPLTSAYYTNNPPTKFNFPLRRKDDISGLRPTNTPLAAALCAASDLCQSESLAASCPSSRPQSSTSAELELVMPNLSLSSPQNAVPQVTTTTRSKETLRFKGKRAYPSIPNQPSEASAHFMFELAKTVLMKAGGNSSTSLFTQASTSQNHHGPHRTLHICAFQIGLYALGLHNCVSPNWLSRTYSSHVSWITGQATEIGAPAITFLINTWEGHLTPPEAVSIADRASRGCDDNIVRAAAELALSCLPHAHALNPNEIQRAILQCKEQSDYMLESSCLTVENAAKGGGVYPEVLFQVAKYWYELYLRHSPGGEPIEDVSHEVLNLDPNGALVTLIEQPPPTTTIDLSGAMGPPPTNVLPGNMPAGAAAQPIVVTTTPPPPYPAHPTVTTLAPLGVSMSMPYPVGPYSFAVQGLPHPHHPHHGFAHHPRTVAHHPHVQMYLSPSAFQYPPHAANQQYPPPSAAPPLQYYSTAVSLAPPTTSGMRTAAVVANTTTATPHHHAYPMTPPAAMATLQVPQAFTTFAGTQTSTSSYNSNIPNLRVTPSAIPQGQIMMTTAPQQQGMPPTMVQQPPVHPGRPQQQVHRQQPQQYSQTQLRYLLAAYRVGMLALETLARRVHDDRPQAKYARNPPYGEDVKWLLRIAQKLGTQYLQQFCVCAVNSIVSPFILHDVAVEAAHYMSRNNPGLVMQNLRSGLTPLVQKCQQMYIQCMHQKLYHLTTADYEDFVNIVCAARSAFQITPEGNTQFKEWLQSIRRSKSCKKDLWTQINTALQANSK